MRDVKSADELLRRSLVWRCVNGGVYGIGSYLV